MFLAKAIVYFLSQSVLLETVHTRYQTGKNIDDQTFYVLCIKSIQKVDTCTCIWYDYNQLGGLNANTKWQILAKKKPVKPSSSTLSVFTASSEDVSLNLSISLK